MMSSNQITKYGLLLFYLKQLRKFNELGLGKQTENKVIITQTLLDTTQRRINQLKTMKGKNNGIRHQHFANTNSSTDS